MAQFMKWEIDRYRARTGETPDFSRAHWRGPVTAQAALELESLQIADLGLAPMVSLTDHDNIDAGLLLRSQAPESRDRKSGHASFLDIPIDRALHIGLGPAHHNRGIAPRQLLNRVSYSLHVALRELLVGYIEILDIPKRH